jgi:hypothetical protein
MHNKKSHKHHQSQEMEERLGYTEEEWNEAEKMVKGWYRPCEYFLRF